MKKWLLDVWSGIFPGLVLGCIACIAACVLPRPFDLPFKNVIRENWTPTTIFAAFGISTFFLSGSLFMEACIRSPNSWAKRLYRWVFDAVSNALISIVSFSLGFIFSVSFFRELGWYVGEMRFGTHAALLATGLVLGYQTFYRHLSTLRSRNAGRESVFILGIAFLLVSLAIYASLLAQAA